MFAPCTVIELDPVPARFCCRITLSPTTSADHPWLELPPRSPTVIATRRDPRAPCPTRHLTDVSDSQSDASHPVCPSRARTVYLPSPMLDPCTVTDDEPVPTRFWRRITLSPPRSDDHACEALPPRSSTVIIICRVPRAPCPTTHFNDVSDSHSVDSHAVRPPELCSCTPPAPCSTHAP